MNSPIRILPPELKLIIRDYASDQTRPSPTAHLMKDLQFDYLPVVNEPVYWPRRLVVQVMNHDPFVRFLNLREQGNRRLRQYMIHNYIPSYWSDYADTFDSEVYEDEELLRRLE